MLAVVKIGTNSVIGNISKIVRDVIKAKKIGFQVILVSSGAVGMGRKRINLGSARVEKQILASIGQVDLMYEYKSEFEKEDYFVGQLLISKKSIEGKKEHDSLENLITEMLKIPNLIPIVNENDAIILKDLMFVDNDEIAGMLTAKFNAKKLILLTNVDGVYEDLSSSDKKILNEISYENIPDISEEMSSMGRGGMLSKINVAKRLSALGIESNIANISSKDVISRICQDEKIGTTFLPRFKGKSSRIRRLLAFEPGINTSGKVFISRDFYKTISKDLDSTIRSNNIIRSVGNFKIGSMVEIAIESNEILGNCIVGHAVAEISSSDLKKSIKSDSVSIFSGHDNLFIV